MATEGDYHHPGLVGQFLREKFNLKTMEQIEEEKIRTNDHVRQRMQETIIDQQQRLEQAETAQCVLQMKMQAADEEFQKAEQQMRTQLQELESKYRQDLEDVRAECQREQELHRAEMKRRAVELDAEKRGSQERNDQLSMSEHNSQDNSKRMRLGRFLDLRNKHLTNSMSLLEKHENEQQDLAKELQVKKMNLVKQQKKEMVLRKTGSQTGVGIRRLGEIDDTCWQEVFRERYKNDDWELEMSKAVSFWAEQIKKQDWHPYKYLRKSEHDESVRVVNEGDPRLKELKARFGENIYDTVATALLEIEEYNPSGRYTVPLPWNYAVNRKASPAEIIKHLEGVIAEAGRARKALVRQKEALGEEIMSLKAALGTEGKGRGKRTRAK